MSKQRPRSDDRWDRTPTGLIVPRRPTLPTRRHINPLGSHSCECCDTTPTGCYIWGDTRPASVDFILSGGVANDYCDCSGADNGTYECDYDSSTGGDPPTYSFCTDNYGVSSYNGYFTSFIENQVRQWVVRFGKRYTTTCWYLDPDFGTPVEAFENSVFGILQQTVPFETGQTYNLGTIYSDTAPSPTYTETACDTSGTSIVVYT